MRRFFASGWFPFVTSVLLGAAVTGAFALLKPTGAGIDNSELLRALTIAGWATGGVMGLLSWIKMMVLNLIRRLFKIRRVGILHPLVGMVAILPWLIFGWILAGEPPYTPFAIGVVQFVARPMLQGSLAVTLLLLLITTTYLIPSRRKK